MKWNSLSVEVSLNTTISERFQEKSEYYYN